MENSVFRNALIFGIIGLFIGLSVVPICGSIFIKNEKFLDNKDLNSMMEDIKLKTLYVGGNGDGNYSKIQYAIDNATDGNIIFVYNGTYFENLVIDIPITLIGENKYTTIIDGSQLDDVISTEYTSTGRININKFTIQNSSGNDYHYTVDAGVAIWGKCNISNNIFQYNKVGILAMNDNNIIANNIIKSCWQNGKGIKFIGTNHDNIIINNEITNMPVGIDIIFSINDTLKNNKLYHNGVGIKFSESNDNFIIFNDIFENNHGVYLDASHNNYIYGNNINSNVFHGLFFELSNGNSINKNLISYTNDYPLGNYYGLYFNTSSSNNISRNIIQHNRVGIKFYENSNENMIYNNDFCNSYQNGRNAVDEYANYWDNENVGNYWDDYTGIDSDGDGIGDTPYNIDGEIYDNYPFINESGWNAPPSKPSINGPLLGKSNISYEYLFCSTDPDNDEIYYEIDWGDEDIVRVGPFKSGYCFKVSHKWIEGGLYDLEICACNFDYIHYIFEGVSNQTIVNIVDADNNPPDKPTIIGESSGKAGIEHEYKFVSIDPEGDDIKEYFIDWGDNYGLSFGPYPSGIEASAKHTWSEKGDYTIKAKAKDVYGAESEWATFAVSMPRNRAMQIPFLNFFEQYPILYQLLHIFLNLPVFQ